jgi:TonB-linked SusC/RagA family outer membrane protein
MKCKLLLSALLSIFFLNAIAQTQIQIKGSVRDENGLPLAGTTVRELSTKQTVITDEQGVFTITVKSAGAALVVSHVGYQEIVLPLQNRRIVDILMVPDAKAMGDVVVVGYGSQKKANLTGSISVVKGSELLKTQAVDLSNALTGRVPGLISKQESGKPGGDAAGYSLRGISTLGDNSPLTLVDGIPRDISAVDPNDIESITVLKDASSAAIYGVRASNGVILVTTKRGREQKPVIAYNGSYGFQQISRPFKWLTAPQYARAVNAFQEATGGSDIYSEADIDIITNHPDNLNTNSRGWGLASTNWFDVLYGRHAPQTQHSLSITGGSARTKYYLSLGYTHQDGFFNTIDYKRYNFRSSVDAQITDDFSGNLDISGRYENKSDIPSSTELYWPLYEARPTDPVRYPNGLISATVGGFQPVSLADSTGYQHTGINVFESVFALKYKPHWFRGFSIRQVFSYDKTFSSLKQFSHPYFYYKYNSATQIYTKMQTGASTNLLESYTNAPSYDLQTIIEYGRQFGKHNINAVLVYEAGKQTSDNLQGQRINYVVQSIDQLFAGPTTGATNYGTATQYARLGQAGRLDYTFNGKYILNFSFRRDGSVNFSPKYRYGFFPGVSVGWVMSKEDFVSKNLPFINNLKLRASYGQLGNDRIVLRVDDPFYHNFGNNNPFNANYTDVQFPYLNLFSFGSTYIVAGNGASTLVPNGVPNEHLTWETTTTKEAGLDLSALNNKLTLEANFYEKFTKNMINLKSDLPGTFGNSSSYENAGESRVRGIELTLKYSGQIGNVNYYISPNFSRSKGILVSWPDPVGTPVYQRRQGHILFPFTGLVSEGLIRTQGQLDKALPQYRPLQLGDVQFKDMNGDGKVDDNDLTVVDKSLVPQTFFGAELGASYKHFDISMLWQGAGDFYYYPILTMQSLLFSGENNSPQYLLDYYSSTNVNAKFPRLTPGLDANNDKISTFWTYNVTYIKLRNVQIGYTFSQKLMTAAKIQSMRVYATLNNVLMFSSLRKLGNIDPETRSYAWNNGNNNYPLTRQLLIGLNISF